MNNLKIIFDVVLDWYDCCNTTLTKTDNGFWAGIYEYNDDKDFDSWLIVEVPKEDVRNLLSGKIDFYKYYREGQVYKSKCYWKEEEEVQFKELVPWENSDEMDFSYEDEDDGYFVEPWSSRGWFVNQCESGNCCYGTKWNGDLEKLMEILEV